MTLTVYSMSQDGVDAVARLDFYLRGLMYMEPRSFFEVFMLSFDGQDLGLKLSCKLTGGIGT